MESSLKLFWVALGFMEHFSFSPSPRNFPTCLFVCRDYRCWFIEWQLSYYMIVEIVLMLVSFTFSDNMQKQCHHCYVAFKCPIFLCMPDLVFLESDWGSGNYSLQFYKSKIPATWWKTGAKPSVIPNSCTKHL